MSITVSNCFQICNSPMNLSSSKMLYSFSKSERFNQLGKSFQCGKVCYDLPSVQEKRSAGIGYGIKYDFTKNSPQTPSPNLYELKTFIESNKLKNKGKSIGVSRDKMEMSGILGELNKFSPGPGAYQQNSQLSKIKWSFRQRTQEGDPLIKDIKKNVPGPGTYQPPSSFNDKGNYFNSKFKNSGSKVFNPPRSKRFPETSAIKPPGPGRYENVSMSKDGKYSISNFKSSKCRTFSHELRKTFSVGQFGIQNLQIEQIQAPGPGAYRLPSDFGYYESKHKIKTVQ